MSRILLLEDDLGLIDGLIFALEKNGFEVAVVRTITEAATVVLEQKFDILLLDLTLPDGSGFEICRKVRKTSNVPIIFLTASDEEVNIVMGLDIGGDDYITKPFSLSVLRARVNTQLRKAAAMSEKEKDNEHVYRKEPYVFDFDRMKFMVDGKETELSKTEQKLLRILVENAGMNMRRELLLDRVWSDGAEYVDENALSVSIKRLRDKLGAEHAIRTVYGIGYRWE